jgi:hypothetical protein
LAIVNQRGGGLEANAFQGSAIAKVFGLEVEGLLEEVVPLHVLLPGLGILTLRVKRLGFVAGDGGERHSSDQQQQECRPHQASHSIILTRWSSLFQCSLQSSPDKQSFARRARASFGFCAEKSA